MKKTYFISFLFILLFLVCFTGTGSIKAAAKSYKFKYKDYSQSKTIKYDGVIPKYKLNGFDIELSDTPPIINENNAAMVSATALIEDKLGGTCSYNKSKKRITIKYNGHVMKLYIGKNEGTLDGELIEVSNPPVRVKYKDSGKITTLIPSRFTLTSLGFEYSYDSTTETVSLKEPVALTINGEHMDYTGTLGRMTVNGIQVEPEETPSVILSDNALFCAREEVFNEAGIEYTYNSETAEICLKYQDNSIYCCLGSRVSYVNGILVFAPIEPSTILFEKNGNEEIYLPGRFVFENLGFSYEWLADAKTSRVSVIEQDKTETITEILEDSTVNYSLPIRIITPEQGYLYFVDKEDCGQYFDIPLPDGMTFEDLTIEEDFRNYSVKVCIPHNQSELYKNCELENTGDGILQIRIYYNPEQDRTEIVFYSAVVLDAQIEEGEIPGYASLYVDFTGNMHKKIVVIDAGHGGHDPGAQYEDYNESDLNLKMLLYLKEYLDKSGIKAYYSRETDVFYSLYDRAAIAENVDADMFISIHHNASTNKETNGTYVYYSELDTYSSLNGLTSEILAQYMQDALVNTLNTTDWGIKAANFVVVRDSKAPAVLLEIGFMSNHDELSRLVKNSFSKKAAKAIYKTIKKMYSL